MVERGLSRQPTNAYGNNFVDQVNPSHAEVMQQLFPNPQGEWLRRRAQGSTFDAGDG